MYDIELVIGEKKKRFERNYPPTLDISVLNKVAT